MCQRHGIMEIHLDIFGGMANIGGTDSIYARQKRAKKAHITIREWKIVLHSIIYINLVFI